MEIRDLIIMLVIAILAIAGMFLVEETAVKVFLK